MNKVYSGLSIIFGQVRLGQLSYGALAQLPQFATDNCYGDFSSKFLVLEVFRQSLDPLILFCSFEKSLPFVPLSIKYYHQREVIQLIMRERGEWMSLYDGESVSRQAWRNMEPDHTAVAEPRCSSRHCPHLHQPLIIIMMKQLRETSNQTMREVPVFQLHGQIN